MSSRLPVTLIGGFLGAGKTSLLHHIISEHQGGYLAVLVESPAAPNLDAKAMRGLCGAMRRLQDVVMEIPNTSPDEQLTWIAAALRDLAKTGRFERVLIEIAGTASPAWLAQPFLEGGPFAPWAELQQVICVADAVDYFRSSRMKEAVQPWWAFQQEQIGAATLVVLNKCDLLSETELPLCTAALRQQHPRARIAETAYGEVPADVWARTAPISQEAEPGGVPPGPETPPLSSALYRVFRPFHPGRFWDWLNGEHAGLLRVKGLVWLASRNLLVGGISRTRWQNSCGAAGIWWAALPREEWPDDEGALRRMQEAWQEPFGDRRQELVLIGEPALLAQTARKALDACLLSDLEYERGPESWSTLPDPFPEWDVEG